MLKILRYSSWLNEQRNKGQLVGASSGKGTTLESVNWKGKLTGPMKYDPNWDSVLTILGIKAKRGEPGSMGIMFGSNALSNTKWSSVEPAISTPPKTTPPKTVPPVITPSVDFKGADFPYPDNIITPDWTKSPSAKAAFDGLVDLIVKYFSLDLAKAKASFQGIAIEGAADIAPATNAIPSGYTKLDHNYGGKSPNNEFLAENRAIKMKEAIVAALTGKLAAETVTAISAKITTSFKTGLERGQRYVKITTTATPYEVSTPGTIAPGTTTPGTETPAQVGPSGETNNSYFVLNDLALQHFFGDSSKYTLDSTAFRPNEKGQSDFRKVKLDALQKWAKSYLGGELISANDLNSLTLTIEFNEKSTPTETPPGALSAEILDQWYTVTFGNVPAGKVIAPKSTYDNPTNVIKCAKGNHMEVFNRPNMQNGDKLGIPFFLFYVPVGEDEAVLQMKSLTLKPERNMSGMPY